MTHRLSLSAKFMLLLVVVLTTGMAVSWVALSKALQRKAQDEVISQAQILLNTMNSVRQYTTENVNRHIKPLLDQSEHFYRETVPGFSAREVFEFFRKEDVYKDFLYKEATLNPTNPRSKADAFETQVAEQFRTDEKLTELSGFRKIGDRNLFYTARPIQIKYASCLECHSTPNAAPAGMIKMYGGKSGFGWKLKEIVGSQIVYVPAEAVFSAGRQSAYLVTGIFVSIFALVALAITVFFRRAVIRPLGGLAAATQALSRGSMNTEQLATSREGSDLLKTAARGDEIGQLADRFKFMAKEVNLREQRLHQARAEVANSEALYRSLVEHASDAVIILNPDFTVRFSAPTLERVIGFSPRIGATLVEWADEIDRNAIQRWLVKATAEPESHHSIEFRCSGSSTNKHLEAVASNLLSHPAVNGIVVNIRDVSEHKQAQEQMRHLAYYDSITGLGNREHFKERVRCAILDAERLDRKLAILFLDLDRFKRINDTLGHVAGDELLRQAATRLHACLRETDLIKQGTLPKLGDEVARLGGDEFTVMLTNLEQAGEVVVPARRILAAFAKPYVLRDHEVTVTGSIGIAVYPQDGTDFNSLLKHADAAMYHAKDQGKNNFQVYTDVMDVNITKALSLEIGLRKALENGQFVLHYQPIVDTSTSRIAGCEALIRWNHPELGSVSPAEFIPLAEEIGLIIPIGEWVLHTACSQVAAWHRDGHRDMYVTVNLSSPHFKEPNLVNFVEKAVARAGVDPQYLGIEVTESIVMRTIDSTINTLKRLKDMSIRMSIDDFGTGYSSLSYLSRFPIDVLKIDRSFVQNSDSTTEDAKITSAIIAMAKSLKLEVVAEGVETESQRTFLKQHQCRYMQGYLFSKPLPAEELTPILQRQIPDRST